MSPPRADANRRASRRQHALLYAGAAAAAAIILLLSFLQSGTEAREAGAPRLAAPGAGVDAGALWRESAARDLERLAESERLLQESVAGLQEQLAAMEENVGTLRAEAAEQAFEAELLQLAEAAAAAEPPPPPAFEFEPPAGPEPARDLPGGGEFAPPPPPVPAGISLVRVGPRQSEAGAGPPSAAPAAAPATLLAGASAPATGDGYIPGGSFMRAVILGGIDAPTGQVSRDNPHPVLLRIADHARLPNLARRDLRECLVLAAGYGDIASERALLRTERMSCQRPDRSFFDAPIRGFVVGEDGRAGLRGRLVTKQGQVLQRSLLAGIGEGFSTVFQNRYVRSSNLGDPSATVDIDVRDYASASIASGASTALGRLADYYLRLADRVHPIIEIGAGRTVDIVLQEGVDLDAKPVVAAVEGAQ
ncbi:MAG: TraB/VirB10 family protein [Betaproteobacteria bacterium AqS2]|uniref:TraB/VirB10 family protein n=1 Tax=Candidatus Amphirhobacter heronislandensis TaxID=1732024 RepID=A0A930UCH7_9GAMM|nr:TraB/VirB10 family protein [Betaproteobacteria bacterium AqS2]